MRYGERLRDLQNYLIHWDNDGDKLKEYIDIAIPELMENVPLGKEKRTAKLAERLEKLASTSHPQERSIYSINNFIEDLIMN